VNPEAWLWSWFASVFCLAFTLRCAFTFAKKQPGIFLALMVHAGQWGVLIAYYSGDPNHQNELLPALSGYLAAVTGFLIYRRHLNSTNKDARRVFATEEVVASLLLLLAVPKAEHLFPRLTERDLDVLVTLVLDTIGFFSMYRAIAVSHPARRTRLALAFPLAAYWIANVAFAVQWYFEKLVNQREPGGMSRESLIEFAVLKIAAVLAFVPAVLAPYEPFKGLTWPERFARLFSAASESP
jgi:hypothetical protein